jgi:hypothetical protein
MHTTLLTLLLLFADAPKTGKLLTEAQQMEYFKIRADNFAAQVDQASAQRVLANASERLNATAKAYEEWLKTTCDGKEPVKNEKGYPMSCPITAEEKKK